jgi:hypothetical protein
MTQDEIIEMAREAGMETNEGFSESVFYFAKLVAEKEREACATMSDWILKEGGGTWGDAIRARGQA